jgi:starch phosphorylase
LRLQQEVVLGMGGVRALRAAGMNPAVWHINEGHAAFLILERVRELTTSGVPFATALQATAAATVFTTHTPVAAGHDIFPVELVATHFEQLVTQLGTTEQELLDLGRVADHNQEFNMTRLALNGAGMINGVSRIHGRVTSELCRDAWPQVPPLENPVGYVTNGVHVPTFMRHEWAELLDQHLGASWRQHLMDRTLIEGIHEIPDGRFWYTNQQVKVQLLRALSARLTRQYSRNGFSEAHIHRLLRFINPDEPNVLTIGFGRRFATYKRSTLLLTNLQWLEQLVGDENRPVVFVFAGKAHPADEPGQWMMREIHRIAGQPQLNGRILLIEGYDAGLSRLLTSGVDVWLNTPVYPFEASGTSGMKAAINGTVNLSVLDGWWAEAYDGRNGWGIPPSIGHSDASERDRQDAVTLYETLQDEVIPLYYERDEKTGSPLKWIELCKRSMASVLPNFNSQRVLHDYARCFYGLAATQGRLLTADGFAAARDLTQWKARARAAWPGVELRLLGPPSTIVSFNDAISIDVDVTLNGLRPEEVRVECLLHRVIGSELTVPIKTYAENRRSQNGITHIGEETAMIWLFEPVTQSGDGTWRYRLECRPPWSGMLSYEVRAVPQHPHLCHAYELGLMRWI